MRAGEFGAQRFGAFLAAKNSAEQSIQRGIVARRERMRDDDVRNESRELFDRRLFVLVEIDHDMRRREFADARDIDVLGAADFGNAAHNRARMDAEAGAADERFGEIEIAQQFREAGYERHDARRRGYFGMVRARGVDERGRRAVLPW